MIEVEVKNTKNEKVDSLELNEEIFGREVKKPLIHQALVTQMASQRQGTASTKTRGEVSGGGKKPWRQKGTGRARAGSSRSPVWKGGGTVFGPRPRDYSCAFPKKMLKSALLSIISSKVKEGELIILDDLEINDPKTKIMAGILKGLNLNSTLFVIGENNNRENLQRASRNIPHLKLINMRCLNVYDLLSHKYMLILKRDIVQLKEMFS
ncbi:MAG: 50S ribosomal protein L4 [Nitrospirota bacterium]